MRSSSVAVAVVSKRGMIQITPRIFGLDCIVVGRSILDVTTVCLAISIDRCEKLRELKHFLFRLMQKILVKS